MGCRRGRGYTSNGGVEPTDFLVAAALVFALSTPTWGAYPGHARNDIQSGVGVVGNAYMLEGTEKSVITGPWIQRPAPVWFATQKNSSVVMEALLSYQAKPSLRTAVRVLAAAIRA